MFQENTATPRTFTKVRGTETATLHFMRGFCLEVKIVYYVYLIKSQQDKHWKYIGSTHDLERRFNDHQNGKVFSTKNYRPFVLVYYEAYMPEKDAPQRERQLKYFGNAYRFLIKRIENSLVD